MCGLRPNASQRHHTGKKMSGDTDLVAPFAGTSRTSTQTRARDSRTGMKITKSAGRHPPLESGMVRMSQKVSGVATNQHRPVCTDMHPAGKPTPHVMIRDMSKPSNPCGYQKVTLVGIFSWLCTFPITLCWQRQTPPGRFWRAVRYNLLLCPSIRPECPSWAVHHRLDKIPDSRP